MYRNHFPHQNGVLLNKPAHFFSLSMEHVGPEVWCSPGFKNDASFTVSHFQNYALRYENCLTRPFVESVIKTLEAKGPPLSIEFKKALLWLHGYTERNMDVDCASLISACKKGIKRQGYSTYKEWHEQYGYGKNYFRNLIADTAQYPDRDKLIRLVVTTGITVEEAQELLSYFGITLCSICLRDQLILKYLDGTFESVDMLTYELALHELPCLFAVK